MRVYVPATFDDLRRLSAERAVSSGREVVGVTPAFTEAYAAGDADELEYAALDAAARRSLDLVRAHDVEPRRVVLSCDTDDLTPGAGLGELLLTAGVPLARVAALHVDDPDVDLDDADGWELMWFATQELDTLLA